MGIASKARWVSGFGVGVLAAGAAVAQVGAPRGATSAGPDAYPSRPIRIVVPYSPGGPADIIGRLIGMKLNEAVRQPVIVDNRPGGNTLIGAEIVAKAQPDGYTLFVTYVGTLAINPSLYAKLPYDPLKDFAPITLLATLPLVLVVHPGLPAQSVKELIALGKAKPGQFTFGSGGVGQGSHLAGELFKSMVGIEMTHVAYKGNAQAAAEVVGGQITLLFDGMSSSLPFIKSGKLKALATTVAKRPPSLPDVPTMIEAGVTGYEVGSWVGLLTTAGAPRPVVDRLNTEVVRILNLPDIRERFAIIGHDPNPVTPDAFSAYIRTEIAKWSKVVKASGARAE